MRDLLVSVRPRTLSGSAERRASRAVRRRMTAVTSSTDSANGCARWRADRRGGDRHPATTAPACALTEAQAIAAVERFIAAWNTRDPAAFAATLHYPHARPEPGGGAAIYATPADYAATVDFAAVEKTGWVKTRLDYARVIQLGPGKAHVAGQWTRLRADGSPILTNQVTYVVTEMEGSIGIQARFSAGAPARRDAERSAAADAAVDAAKAYMKRLQRPRTKAPGPTRSTTRT